MSEIIPPKAKIIPKELTMHQHTRVDNYYWLNDREDAEVIAYLEEENNYYQAKMAHTKDFQENLFQEMKARIKEDDSSVPYFYNGYFYITRFESGKNYPIYSRKKESLSATEEILLDCNQLAEGHAFFQLGTFSVSPDNTKLLYSFDVVGRRIYTIAFKDLQTQNLLVDTIEGTTGSAVWANDNQTIFYTTQDAQTLRACSVYKHKLGQIDGDALIYFEKDETFNIDIAKSKSRKYLAIESGSTLTTEYRILEADMPDNEFRIFQKRKRGVEYGIYHFEDSFYILTNKDDADNFKLMKTPENQTSVQNWVEVMPHREDVLLEGIEIFKDFLVVEERSNGLNHIQIIPWKNPEAAYFLPFDSETYTASVGINADFDTPILRYSYQSMNTPSSVIDFNMITKEKEIKKEQEILGGKFDKNNYQEERLWATARDGIKVPISIVYKKGLKKDGQNPLLQYAYGSYGYSIEATFSSTRLSLLDRGFVFAIAHIRGGEELGRKWYEDGKLLHKKNTFTDFIDCSKFLIAEGFTSSEHLYAEGGSAGGLLMGAIANMEPELYHGIIAQVPFVDVVTTMLDESIPLTTGEYDEWGNPNEKEYYDYMLSYSPYDNVEPKDYPHFYISTGLHDSQVQYWEPAKWVAKLRELKTNNNLLFLDTNMDAGHGGASGRFEALRELAKEMIFLFDLEKIRE